MILPTARFSPLLLSLVLAAPALAQEQPAAPVKPAQPVKAAKPFKPKPATGPINVGVDASSHIGAVDPRFFGLNEIYYDYNFNRPETPGIFKDLAPSMLRWPGGSQADTCDWTVDRTLKMPKSMYKVTTKQFVQAMDGQNIHTIITTNYGTGSPEMAAAWVAWADGSPTDTHELGTDQNGRDWKTVGYWASLRAAAPLPGVDDLNHLRLGQAAPLDWMDWEIGNEIFGTWEKDTFSKHDGYDYATRATQYLQQMRAVDPKIRIYAVADDLLDAPHYEVASKHPVTNPRDGTTHNAFTPVMLARFKELGIYPDGIVYHRYAIAPKTKSVFVVSAAWPQIVAQLRQTINDYAGDRGKDMQILCTETNYGSPWPNKVTINLQNALLMADTFGIGMTTELKTIMWWVRETGSVDIIPPAGQFPGWRTGYTSYALMSGPVSTVSGMAKRMFLPDQKFPTYFAFKLMQHFATGGDTVVKVNCSDADRLSAYAVKGQDGGMNLLLINKSYNRPQQVDLTLPGFDPTNSATVYSYGRAQDENARQNLEDKGTRNEDITQSTLDLPNGPVSVAVEPGTMIVIQLKPHK